MSISPDVQERVRSLVEAIPRDVSLGEPQRHLGLTLFPLISSASAKQPGFVTLDQALDAGNFRVTEVSVSGSVPDLRVANDGDLPVLMLDGEELVGAKQNRVLNVTVLVPAKSTIVIPVACVEAGRWARVRAENMEFMSAKHVTYSKLRMMQHVAVAASAAAGGGYRSDQGRVWDDIASKAERLGSRSRTSAAKAMFDQHEGDLDGFVQAFSAVDGQTGAAFCLGNSVAGAELFGHPSILSELLGKLVKSYALDAVELGKGDQPLPDRASVERFLGEVGSANKEVREAVGAGLDVRLTAPRLVGGALIHDDTVVHLSAFRLDADEDGGRRGPRRAEGYFSPLSRRRRGRM